MTGGNGQRGGGPVVPRSLEEVEQERLDAEQDAREHAAMLVRARESARLLVLSCLLCTGVASAVVLLFFRGPTGYGVVLGSVVMTANLAALSALLRRVLLEEQHRLAFGLLLVGSFLALAGVSAWVIRTWQEMAFGFGVGLSVPAVGGMVWSLFRRGRSMG